MRTKNRYNVLKAVFAVVLVLSCMVSQAFAENADGLDKTLVGASTIVQNVIGVMVKVAVPLAVVAFAVCGLKIFWGDAKAAEHGKAAMIRIAIGLVVVFFATTLVAFAVGVLGNAAITD